MEKTRSCTIFFILFQIFKYQLTEINYALITHMLALFSDALVNGIWLLAKNVLGKDAGFGCQHHDSQPYLHSVKHLKTTSR